MIYSEQFSSPDVYRGVNKERLKKLFKTPFAGAIFDVDGTISLHGKPHPEILQAHGELLSKGVILAPSTARGESLHSVYTDQIGKIINEKGLDSASVPAFSTTRNGAVTEHLFTGEIIDDHPFPKDLYKAVMSHELVKAIEILTPTYRSQETIEFYDGLYKKTGIPASPEAVDHPAIFHDIHRTSGKMYKMNFYYNPQRIDEVIAEKGEPARNALSVVNHYAQGVDVNSPHRLGKILKKGLMEEGVFIESHCQLSDKEIDITVAGVDKSTGYNALRPIVKHLWGLSDQTVDRHILTIGDSPLHNDKALLRCGVGVTNTMVFNPEGPIALDIPSTPNQLDKTLYLFKNMKVMGKLQKNYVSYK